MRFLPVTHNALLVELADLDQTLALLASLQRHPPHGVEELVPAARTILVEYRASATRAETLVQDIAARSLTQGAERSDTLIEIPVHYNGEDLAEVAQILGITADEVVQRHTGSEYTVAFTGFAPGFAYLSGGHPSLNVPRRATPRTRVPAGSVALAGTFAAVYPDATPGGWQLLGTTALPMWDLAREPPALLQPGMRVRFVDETTKSIAGGAYPTRSSGQKTLKSTSGATPPDDGRPALIVQASGLQTLVQDAGRPGLAAQGVSAAGALDAGAMRRANRLVGNASNQPVLEALAGGLQLTSQGDTVLAVTGATGALMLSRADGRTWPVERNQALALAAGDTLMLGQPATGLRSYVAVRGGFVIAPVLGSASRDTLAKIGRALCRERV